MHYRHKKSLSKKTVKLLVCLFLSIFVLLVIFLKIDLEIKPVLFNVSGSEVKIMATESINKVVKEQLTNNVKYSDFVNIKTDKNGDISAIELNTIEMNKFGSEVALKVQEEMKFIGGRGIGIPLGVITGSTILSYLGPKIYVNVMPIGNVTTEFKSELQSAGINQSRYRVYITVNTELQIMVPFGSEKMNVSSTIPIAETLIVGKVPQYLFNSQSGGASTPNVIPVPVPENN